MKHLLLPFAVLFVLAFPHASAQTDSARLSLNIDAVTFLRDAEYFMPFTKGYTASGFRLSPTLCYRTNERTSISGGFILNNIAGSDSTSRLLPVLTIDFQPSSWLHFIMGTIHGSVFHQLGEPMYDPERWIYDYQENGIQILTRTPHWNSDTWVNWEQFLYPWTANQERFSLGTRHQFVLLSSQHTELTLPASFLGCHRGGQFSTLDTCIETLFNESVGMRLRLNLDSTKTGHSTSLQVDAPFYFFQNMSPTPATAFSRGWGAHPQLACHLFWCQSAVDLIAGYWYGHNFLSSRGSYLYQSVSWHDADFVAPERHMLTANAHFMHHLKHFSLGIGVSVYYDTDLHDTDFAFSVCMQFLQSFRLN